MQRHYVGPSHPRTFKCMIKVCFSCAYRFSNPSICQFIQARWWKVVFEEPEHEALSIVEKWSASFGLDTTLKDLIYLMVSDTPCNMLKIRNLCTGGLPGGKFVWLIAYGCACHELSLIIKKITNFAVYKDLFKKVITIDSNNKKTTLPFTCFMLEAEKMNLDSRKTKTFSVTQCNGCV